MGPIFPSSKEKHIKGSKRLGYPSSKIWKKTIVEILRIYGARAISYRFVITKTLNMSDEK